MSTHYVSSVRYAMKMKFASYALGGRKSHNTLLEYRGQMCLAPIARLI